MADFPLRTVRYWILDRSLVHSLGGILRFHVEPAYCDTRLCRSALSFRRTARPGFRQAFTQGFYDPWYAFGRIPRGGRLHAFTAPTERAPPKAQQQWRLFR